jgi:hypothetical protein
MEGSMTLHHWSRLATPHLGTLLEERPGVTTRETDSKHMAGHNYPRDLLGRKKTKKIMPPTQKYLLKNLLLN